MRFNNHEVWLAYDGVRVPEVAPSIPDAYGSSANTAKAYLMSEIDKVFSINWRHLVPQSLLSISIRMDGILVHQRLSIPGSDGGQLCGVISGPKSIRPFIFSKVPRLQSADIELARADPIAPRDFGTIRVTIVPLYCVQSNMASIAVGGPLCGNISPSPRFDMHCISLDEERPIGPGGHSPAIPVMPPFDVHLMNEEAVNFEFRYGPLVYLQNVGAIPARTVVAESGSADASPPITSPITSSPSMLGKRSRSQYEVMSSLSEEAETDVSSSVEDTDEGIIRTFITRRLVKAEVVENTDV